VFSAHFLDKKAKKSFNLTMRILHYLGLILLFAVALLPLPSAVMAAGG
jgi:hypothetical protein